MSAPEPTTRSWTARVREAAVGALPPERLLPDEQPIYVASWIYVFGVLSIASLLGQAIRRINTNESVTSLFRVKGF